MNEEVVELASNGRGEFRTPFVQLPSLLLNRCHFLETYQEEFNKRFINNFKKSTRQEPTRICE